MSFVHAPFDVVEPNGLLEDVGVFFVVRPGRIGPAHAEHVA